MSTPAPEGREDAMTCVDCDGIDFATCPDCGALYCTTCLGCDCVFSDMPDHTGHRWIDLGDGTFAHAQMRDDASPEAVAAVTELARLAKQRMKEPTND